MTEQLEGQVSIFDLVSPFGKTSPERFQATRAVTSEKSCKRSPISERDAEQDAITERAAETKDVVIWTAKRQPPQTKNEFLYLNMRNGNLLGVSWEMTGALPGASMTLSIGPAPRNGGGVSSLSQILEANVPEKYYLSPKACQGILRRAERRGKEIPQMLKEALLEVVSLSKREQDAQGGGKGLLTGVDRAFTLATNNNDRVAYRNVYGIDCRNAKLDQERVHTIQAKPGSGYSLNVTPSICYPSVVYENHGQDSRYTGPSDVSQTVSAHFGTGGNNTPLVVEGQMSDKGFYTLQSFGEYQEGEVASNLQSRDYKYATDLIAEKADRKYIVRRLTPTECARLQGFPDWWTDGADGSDSQKYRLWGNGVALPCVKDVLRRVVKAIREGDDE